MSDRADEIERLLGRIVGGDYGDLCDHPADCSCTAAQAIRLLDIVPEPQPVATDLVAPLPEPVEVVDLVAALRASVEAAKQRRLQAARGEQS